MDEKLIEIVKQLNDSRNKLLALKGLYNTYLLQAEDDRSNLTTLFEQMVDYKNDLNTITKDLGNVKKADRSTELNKNKNKINLINKSIDSVSNNFKSTCKNYREALKECGSLKTEYKHEVSELTKEFKANLTADTQTTIIKGYKQQVRVIKAIFDRIEVMIADYNSKRNKVEEDSERFNALKDSVNVMLSSLENIA